MPPFNKLAFDGNLSVERAKKQLKETLAFIMAALNRKKTMDNETQEMTEPREPRPVEFSNTLGERAQDLTPEAPFKCDPVPRVKYIGLSRLFNLGNYENIKFDVGVDVPEGASAAETMLMLLKILQKLRPIKIDYQLKHAMEMLATPESEYTESQRGLKNEWEAKVEAHNRRLQERKDAIAKLDHLGGTSTHKDAKDNWEDEEFYED